MSYNKKTYSDINLQPRIGLKITGANLAYKNNIVFQDGVLITFHHAKRKQKIGDVQVNKGETVLHQIANKESGNGKAKKILLEFFEWCPKDVYLSVRADNLKACEFYDRIAMKLIGTHNWAKGKVKGKVYVKRKPTGCFS